LVREITWALYALKEESISIFPGRARDRRRDLSREQKPPPKTEFRRYCKKPKGKRQKEKVKTYGKAA
jgi:hypothetical protein